MEHLPCKCHEGDQSTVLSKLNGKMCIRDRIDGIISIAEGKQHVLAGAMDEITPTSHIIQQRLGLLKGTTAGEGAQFFLLSAQKEEQTFAELKGVDTFITRMSAPEISNRMHHFLKSHGLAPEDIDWFISGKNGQEATDAVYTDLEHSLFPHALHSSFKEQCGEYQTASSYALWMAAKALKEEASSRYALIYNQYQGIKMCIRDSPYRVDRSQRTSGQANHNAILSG